tara:strand:+ start:1305 stop:1490 length:186 start_codon:yes stop_codon:yes gene_type:complete
MPRNQKQAQKPIDRVADDIIMLKLEIEALKKELKIINNKLIVKEKIILDRQTQVEKGWVWW